MALSLYQYYRSFRADQRSQAELIGAWWVRIDFGKALQIDDENYSNPIVDPENYCIGIVLKNPTNATVSDVEVCAPGFRMLDGRFAKTLDDRREPKDYRLEQEVLTPGEFACLQISAETDTKTVRRDWAFPEHTSSITGKIRPVSNDAQWHICSLAFTDSSGRRWERTRGKGLRPVHWYQSRQHRCPRQESSRSGSVPNF